MTDLEKQKFQIRTIFLNVGLTLAITVAITAWGYNRSDNKDLLLTIDSKVGKPEFILYQEGVKAEFRQVKIDNDASWKSMDGKIDKIYEYLLNERHKK